MVTIVEATPEHIPAIARIAEQTWWPTYSSFVPKEQIRYMLDVIYSSDAMLKVMQEGSQTFILLQDALGFQGFASYGKRKDDPAVFKLHKLYVLPENQGKGYGKVLIDEVRTRIQQVGSSVLDLNVNRNNNAISFYERMGFQKIREEDVPIGPYWMNDYVMRWQGHYLK